MRILIQKLLFLIVMTTLSLGLIRTSVFAGSLKTMGSPEEAKELLNLLRASPKMQQNRLPQPYQNLLSQPLLTKGLEKYYQRTAVVQKIYSRKNKRNNTYFRAIIMLMDRDKTRNNPKFAQQEKETRVVELAFITINLNALPKQMTKDILYTNVPFGTLLSKHHVEIYTMGRSYFSTQCITQLAALVPCRLKTKIYGRTNTIMQTDNKKWLADVVEVLL